MKKKMGWLLLMVLGIMLGCSSITYADEEYSYIQNDDGTITLTKYNGTASNVVIPESIDGFSITAIGDSCFSMKKVKSVSMPDTITEIGKSSFSQNDSLSTIQLSNNLKAIGNYAFDHCNLTALELPDSLESIGDTAFYGNKNLKTQIKLPDSLTHIGINPFLNTYVELEINPAQQAYAIIDGVLFEKDSKKLIAFPLSGKASNYVTNYTVPEGIVIIGDKAFSGCSQLKSITLPDTVETIGDSAFTSCSGLTSINIPDTVTSIGKGAFERCKNVTLQVASNDCYAAEYAKENEYNYDYKGSSDWLNN